MLVLADQPIQSEEESRNLEPPTSSPGSDQRTRGSHHRHWRRLINRRLLMRVTIPTLIGVVLLALSVQDLIRGHVSLAALLWLLPGIAVGFGFGRMTRVAWDSDTSQVVQNGSGLALLVAYVGVRVGEGYLLTPRFVDWPYINNAAALVGVGLLFGKVLGTLGSIRGALDEPEGG